MRINKSVYALIALTTFTLTACMERTESYTKGTSKDRQLQSDSTGEVITPTPNNSGQNYVNGLKGEYFENIDFQSLAFSRVDPAINFDLSTALVGTAITDRTYMSIKWTGTIRVPAAGNYTFYSYVDDGTRLTIDGKVILNDWDTTKGHAPKEITSSVIALQANKDYPIIVDYFNLTGQASVDLKVQGPGIVKQLVPSSYFRTQSLVSAQPSPMASPGTNPVNASFSAFKQVMTTRCAYCHNTSSLGDFTKLQTEAQWRLSGYITLENGLGNAQKSKVYYRMINSLGTNGPKNMPSGTNYANLDQVQKNNYQNDLATVAAYIASVQDDATVCQDKSPDYIPPRRITIRELITSLGDLTGQKPTVPGGFPKDSPGSLGFDNDTLELSMSSILLSKMVGLADETLSKALSAEATGSSPKVINSTNCDIKQDACRSEIIKNFALRAYRKPLANDQLTALANLAISVKNSYQHPTGNGTAAQTPLDAPTEGLKTALLAVLSSANYLYRIEQDTNAPNTIRNLNSYEIASRLASLIWSSVPDKTLLDLAAQNQLTNPNTIKAQVTRMLSDPKGENFTKGFVAQWLELDKISEATPLQNLFGTIPAQLLEDMKYETIFFAIDLIKNNRSIRDLLSESTTFLNERLAKHYGRTDVTGNNFRSYTFPNSIPHDGILTHAGILTFTSKNTGTLPTRRGAWVMAKLLCEPLGLPPADAGSLPTTHTPGSSVRQVFEQHASSPECASCHDKADPIGFGLENFDGVGKYRTKDDYSQPVNAAAEIYERAFSSPQQLTQVVRDRPEYGECITRHLLTYAVKVPETISEKCTNNEIADKVNKGNGGFQDLIKEVVTSSHFMQKRSR